jgi:hypothetical protein
MCLNNACIQKLQASQGTVEDRLFGKRWKHPNNGIVLKGFYFMIIHFLNHTIVITEELFAIFILNKRFFKTYTIFKLIYFLHPILCTIPYLLKHLFQSLCSLESRYQNSGNIFNPEQVRSCTFWVNYLLL